MRRWMGLGFGGFGRVLAEGFPGYGPGESEFDMSNAGTRVRPRRSRVDLFRVVLGVVLAAGVVFLVGLARGRSPAADLSRTTGRMVESRVVVDGYQDAAEARPAWIQYRLEARVEFDAGGVRRTEWLPTGERGDSRDWVLFRLSQRRSDTVVVAWNPRDATKGLVTLDWR